ncbi:MAG: ribosome silencing factor [Bacteroidota bacterium]|nr:ribosome silencing factor [Bacteroidota bacterium]
MAGKKKNNSTTSDLLAEIIVKGIEEKKGENITSLNLKNIKSAICDYFIICDANSKTQVEAICESIETEVKKAIGLRPHHIEGIGNSEWVLLDYFDIIVHVFLKESREFYKLESTWADAEFKRYQN